MRRSSLLTLTALGALICLIGGTGLFAALTDTARTGTNTVDSAALAGSADIQIATAVQEPWPAITCGSFSEDLATGFFTASDARPGEFAVGQFFCLKNVGSQTVTISGMADELTDVDFACTGDEALLGDATCGNNGAGELSDVLRVYHIAYNCTTGGGTGNSSLLRANATTQVFYPGTLAAGQTGCFHVSVEYPSTTATDAVQKAQSDRVTWRFKFTAQV
jgi:hypothetical protein